MVEANPAFPTHLGVPTEPGPGPFHHSQQKHNDDIIVVITLPLMLNHAHTQDPTVAGDPDGEGL